MTTTIAEVPEQLHADFDVYDPALAQSLRSGAVAPGGEHLLRAAADNQPHVVACRD